MNGSGFNEKYGLLGSNKAIEEKLKFIQKKKEAKELVKKKCLKRLAKKSKLWYMGMILLKNHKVKYGNLPILYFHLLLLKDKKELLMN